MSPSLRPALPLVAAVWALACAGEPPPTVETPASPVEDEDVEPTDDTDVDSDSSCDPIALFADHGCTTCHSDTAPAGGIDLVSDQLGDRLAAQRSIHRDCAQDPILNVAEPEASLLLRAIDPDRYAGYGSDTCEPARMPPAGAGMPSEDVDCLHAWIEALEPVDLKEVTELGDALTVLHRTKLLLHGGAVTAEELERAQGEDGRIDPGALRSLVREWMDTPEFFAKRRQFLRLTLQQTPADTNYYYQFRNTVPGGLIGGVRTNFQDSIIRTAERIIDRREDFRTIVTTNEWELTSAMILALRMADNVPIYSKAGNFSKNNPNNDITYPFRTKVWDSKADARDWRTVRLLHDPASTDYLDANAFMEEEFIDSVRGLPDGGSLTLRTPRMGYFTSPAFFQTWQTNGDNDFRVTLNQAVIIATGRTFSVGDTTPHNTGLEAVDLDQFPVDSECYGCHKNMEPMIGVFKEAFDNVHTRYPGPDVPDAVGTDFVFQSASEPVEDLHEFADALAHHPEFGRAWVLKMCEWASSTACDPNDDAVLALTTDFENSGYDLQELFVALFSSPVVTHTSFADAPAAPGAHVSLSRTDHYCHAMEVRLSRARSAQGRGSSSKFCTISDDTKTMAASIPSSEFVRGQTHLHQPTEFRALAAVSYNGLCLESAGQVVGSRGVFRHDRPERVQLALDQMTSEILGIPEGTEAYAERRELLQRVYDVHLASPGCETPESLDAAFDAEEPSCGLDVDELAALRGVWTMVCQSPSLTGVGL